MVVGRDAQHAPLYGDSLIHDFLSRFAGSCLEFPLIAFFAGITVVNHVNGFSGVHAAGSSGSTGIFHLNGKHPDRYEGLNACIFITGRRNDGRQPLSGKITHCNCREQKHDADRCDEWF